MPFMGALDTQVDVSRIRRGARNRCLKLAIVPETDEGRGMSRDPAHVGMVQPPSTARPHVVTQQYEPNHPAIQPPPSIGTMQTFIHPDMTFPTEWILSFISFIFVYSFQLALVS